MYLRIADIRFDMEVKDMSYTYEEYDVVVIGAGHAGCEAALAAARRLLLSISIHTLPTSLAFQWQLIFAAM